MDKLVSIAIASYNNGKYIERCVESVIHQTYQNLEILIVDDGSCDDTLSRLEKYKSDKRIKIICKENGGLSSVRQMALEMAQGDYISFIDADDYLAPEYIKAMLSKLLADQSDICVCSSRFEDKYGTIDYKGTKMMECQDSQSPIRVDSSEISILFNKIAKKVHLSDSWNKMYSVDFIRRSKVLFNMPKGLNGTDTIFNRKLALHRPIYSTIAYTGYIHVIYQSSAVHRKNKDLQRSFMVITEGLLDETAKLGISQECKYMLSSYYYGCLFRAFYDAFHDTTDNRYDNMSQMLMKHDDFVKEHGLIPANISMSRQYSRKIFIFLLRFSRWLLPTYFCILSFAKK